MAINKNFVVKNGLEVNTNQIFADSASGKVGIGSTLPTVELDVQGAIAATDVVSSLLRVTGYSTLPQVTVNDNLYISGFTTASNELNVLGITSLSNFKVVGITTFGNDVNLSTNLNVAGFSTFVGVSSFVGSVEVTGLSTFSSNVDINASLDVQNDINVAGVVTATAFFGSFTGSGIAIGIQSGGSTVSTATSTLNFEVTNATLTINESDGDAGITTVLIGAGGISLGLAIALGS